MVTEAQHVAYCQAKATAMESTMCLLSAFNRLGVPDSLIDVGCGDGHLVRAASAIGAKAAGCDIMVKDTRIGFGGYTLSRADLTNPWNPPFQAKMVLCWEVAEHLPESAANALCSTLSKCCAPGGILLFSAATPGQGGSGHLNEQPHDYWTDKLIERGFAVDDTATDVLRWIWSEISPAAWWYGKNIIVLKKTDTGGKT